MVPRSRRPPPQSWKTSLRNQVRTHISLDKDVPEFRHVSQSVTSLRCLGRVDYTSTTSEFEFSVSTADPIDLLHGLASAWCGASSSSVSCDRGGLSARWPAPLISITTETSKRWIMLCASVGTQLPQFSRTLPWSLTARGLMF